MGTCWKTNSQMIARGFPVCQNQQSSSETVPFFPHLGHSEPASSLKQVEVEEPLPRPAQGSCVVSVLIRRGKGRRREHRVELSDAATSHGGLPEDGQFKEGSSLRGFRGSRAWLTP